MSNDDVPQGAGRGPRGGGSGGAGARLCIVLRPAGREAIVARAQRCLRRLVPQAHVVVEPAAPPVGFEVVTLEAEEVAAGPLSAATALRRARRVRRGPG